MGRMWPAVASVSVLMLVVCGVARAAPTREEQVVVVARTTCPDGGDSPWCLRVSATAPELELELDGTPWDPVAPTRAFEVRDARSGETLPFDGPVFKRVLQRVGGRVHESADKGFAFAAERAGVTAEAVVDLSDGFLFKAGGSYVVSLKPLALSDASGTQVVVSVVYDGAGSSSSGISFSTVAESIPPWEKDRIAGARTAKSAKRMAIAASERQDDGGYYISACSTELESKIENSVNVIYAATGKAISEYLDVLEQTPDNCSSSNYVEYFGAVDSSRANVVRSSMERTVTKMEQGGFIVECGGASCSESTFAYVFPRDPEYTIHLCLVGQSAPGNLEENSQPGTLLHEFLHFVTIGNTDDHRYGVTACRELAKESPNLAIDNSDSYEYFVEFVPDCADKDGDGGGFCFPASATIQLESGAHVRMDELKIGDRVLVGTDDGSNSADGEHAMMYSAVYAFGHAEPFAAARDYVRLELSCGATITASAGHLLYADERLRAARDVALGDSMRCVKQLGSGGDSVASRDGVVTKIERNVALRGRFNPHTTHGDIVVDGVLASTYTNVLAPALAHALLLLDRLALALFARSFLSPLLRAGCPRLLHLALSRAGLSY